MLHYPALPRPLVSSAVPRDASCMRPARPCDDRTYVTCKETLQCAASRESKLRPRYMHVSCCDSAADQSCPFQSCPVLSCAVFCCRVAFCYVLSCRVLPCPDLLSPALLYFMPCRHDSICPALSCALLSCHAPPCPATRWSKLRQPHRHAQHAENELPQHGHVPTMFEN